MGPTNWRTLGGDLMPKSLTIPCGNCGTPVTGPAAGIKQRLI